MPQDREARKAAAYNWAKSLTDDALLRRAAALADVLTDEMDFALLSNLLYRVHEWRRTLLKLERDWDAAAEQRPTHLNTEESGGS
jgi:hypothetical protein